MEECISTSKSAVSIDCALLMQEKKQKTCKNEFVWCCLPPLSFRASLNSRQTHNSLSGLGTQTAKNLCRLDFYEQESVYNMRCSTDGCTCYYAIVSSANELFEYMKGLVLTTHLFRNKKPIYI